jgi:1-deoxy-D-xylulose-5-phosphate synthase
MVYPALEASRILSARGVSCAVVNARFIKPLDTSILAQYASSTGMIITCEDAALSGGLGSAVLEALADAGMGDVRVVRLGIPDRFIEHGRRDDILAQLGLDSRGIAATVLRALSERADAKGSGGGAHVSTL